MSLFENRIIDWRGDREICNDDGGYLVERLLPRGWRRLLLRVQYALLYR